MTTLSSSSPSSSTCTSAWVPQPLVVVRADGALSVPDQARAVLQALQAAHVHVVGVLGASSTSTTRPRALLRAMLHAEALPQDQEHDNVVLWMWQEQERTQAATTKTNKTEPSAVRLILALDDQHELLQQQHGVALLLLLSSMLFYDDDGPIDDQALERLQWLHDVASSLRIAPNQDDVAVLKAFQQHAPLFVWTLENTKIKWLSSGMATLSTLEYLEQQLADETGFSGAVMTRNTARMYLRTLFPLRDCVFLPRAVDAGAENTAEVLREPFTAAVNKLSASRVSSKAVAQNQFPLKRVMGKELRGPHLVVVLDSYLQSINAGGLPTIQVASTAIVQTTIEEAFTEARKMYAAATSAVFGVEDEDLANERPCCASKTLWVAHFRGLQAACNYLQRLESTVPAKMRPSVLQQRKQFEVDAEQQLQTACARNKQRSTASCKRVLKEVMPQGKVESLITSLESRRRQSFPDRMSSSMVQYKSDLQVAMEKYRMTAQGPDAFAVLEESILASVRAFTSAWGPSILQRYQQHLRSIQAQRTQLEHELESLKAQDTSATFSAEDHKRLYEEQLASATQQLTELRRVLQGELNDKKSELERSMGEMTLMDGKHEAHMKAIECDLAWVRSRSLELEKAAREERKRLEFDESGASMEMEAKERNFQEEEQALMEQHKKLMARVVELEREVVEKKTGHVQQVFKMEAETSHQLNGLHREQDDFVRQLKTQVKSDKGVLRLSFQKTKMAAQTELEQVEREIYSLQHKLGLFEPQPSMVSSTSSAETTPVSVAASESARASVPAQNIARSRSMAGFGKKSVSSRTSVASTLSSRISSFQLFPTSPRQSGLSPRNRRAATFAPSTLPVERSRSETDMCKTQ